MNISINNLGIKYDGHILFEDVSFEVQSGQRFCINGPSGSGKSSILRVMLGFIQPQAGEIVVGNQPVNDKTIWQIRRSIAYVTQEPDLGQQVVLDRIRHPFDYKTNAHLKWNTETVQQWFERFKLPCKLLGKQTTDLSGGEKQRVAIIIALLLDRPILLLDEPASALDKQSKHILRAVLSETKKTIVFISHEESLLDIANATLELLPSEGGVHE